MELGFLTNVNYVIPISQQAFSGVVVEKKVLDPLPSLSTEQKSPEKRQESTPEEIQKPARVSKFKAQRQNLSKS